MNVNAFDQLAPGLQNQVSKCSRHCQPVVGAESTLHYHTDLIRHYPSIIPHFQNLRSEGLDYGKSVTSCHIVTGARIPALRPRKLVNIQQFVANRLAYFTNLESTKHSGSPFYHCAILHSP